MILPPKRRLFALALALSPFARPARASSWVPFAEYGELGRTVVECRPALAWTAAGLPVAAWSEGGMGDTSPAHAISLGWFDAAGTLSTAEITPIPLTDSAAVELIMRPGDRPLVLFVQNTEKPGSRRLMAARSERLGGPWQIETVADEGGMVALSAAAVGDTGLARVAWYDSTLFSLWFAEERADGGWDVELVTASGGRHQSLLTLPDGRPWLAFQGADAATLWFAERLPEGWATEAVAPGGGWASAALDAAGEPAVAHVDPLAEQVLFQPFVGGQPLQPQLAYAGVATHTALAFDPVGRPHIAMSRSELVKDPWGQDGTLFTLEIRSPDPGSGEWAASEVDQNLMGGVAAGCVRAALTHASLDWSPQGLPAILYQEHCTAHPSAHRSVLLAFLARPWEAGGQPVITGIEPATGGALAVSWSAQPDACYSLWLRLAPGLAWARAANGLCAGPGQHAFTFEIPADTLDGAGWVRVAHDYP